MPYGTSPLGYLEDGPGSYPGSSGFSTLSEFPSIYSYGWDPATGRVKTNDPRSGNYGTRTASAWMPSASVNVNGQNPYQSLLGYNPASILSGSGTTYSSGGPGPTNPANPNQAPAQGNVRAQLLSNPGAAPGTTPANLATPGTGYNPGAAPGQGYNPFFTLTNVKSPDIAQQVNNMLAQYGNVQGLNPTSAIQGQMAQDDPLYRQYLAQETGAVSQWYPGTPGGTSAVQNQLAQISAQRAQAYQAATGRAMDVLSQQQALQQQGMGGAGTVGGGSYLQKQGLDTAANMQVQQGLDAAQQAYQNYLTSLQGQQQNLGVRGGLQTQDIQRQLIPSQVGSQWFNQMLAGLGPLAQTQLANSFYGLGGGLYPGAGGPLMGGGSGIQNPGSGFVRNSAQVGGGVYPPGYNPGYMGVPNSAPVGPAGSPGNPQVVTQYQNQYYPTASSFGSSPAEMAAQYGANFSNGMSVPPPPSGGSPMYPPEMYNQFGAGAPDYNSFITQMPVDMTAYFNQAGY